MARIKINDLPKDMKISKEDMRKITGGALLIGTAEAEMPKFNFNQPEPPESNPESNNRRNMGNLLNLVERLP